MDKGIWTVEEKEQTPENNRRKINWWNVLPIGSNIRETIQDLRVMRDSLKRRGNVTKSRDSQSDQQ